MARIGTPIPRHLPAAAVLVVAGLLLAVLCQRYDVVQDDAYISLVYAKNWVDGQGLVFNPGERVEGYTNFLWVALMTAPHALGVDAVACTRVLGALASLGLLIAGWRLAAAISTRPRDPVLLAVPLWLAANGALAFWTLSGMETAAFALLVCLGAERYLRRGRLDAGAGLLFGLAALTRPEGWMFFGLTLLHQGGRTLLATRGRPTVRSLWALWPAPACFGALVLPHLAWRWTYYGYPLPNTFYAKTGISLNYLDHGLRYTWGFLADYGLWGLGPLAAAVLLLRRRTRWRVAYGGLLVAANMTYVTLVGGDTMAENRLYLPTLALLAALMAEALRLGALRLLGRRPGQVGAAAAALLVATLWVLGPDADLLHARAATEAHNAKLHELADYILATGDTFDLVASTAIGIPRYRTDAAVLDLVGLTDETVAHDPAPLTGVRDDHILRNYNAAYAMDRAPEAILFVTGVRPGTPAERALFLSRRFRRGYYLSYLQDQRPLFVRRAGADAIAPDLYPDGAFVERYAEGLAVQHIDPERAAALFEESIRLGPKDFAPPHEWLGRVRLRQGRLEEAAAHFQRAVDIDPFTVMAWSHLAFVDLNQGRDEVADARAARAVELAPRSHFCRYVHGLTRLASGDAATAAAELAVAARVGGSYTGHALYWLGIALERQGDFDAARSTWTSLLAQRPDFTRAREALERLPSP